MIVAATPIEELPAAEDAAVREVQPEVRGQVTLFTLPACGRDLLPIVQLLERLSMPTAQQQTIV